ncbi:MAG: S-layer homology domain-containing protein [Oscillospiraceae bacterium]|nr:S-layer homology domain-containing protein [Oscillospiraceae bacterium]
MKRILAILLATVLLLGTIPAALAAQGMSNFRKTQTYTDGQFADVAASAWYAGGVRSAYELGLMKGASAAAFNPTGNLTIAEALTIACRMHSIYHGDGETFPQGTPWYQVYLDYGLANGVIKTLNFNPAAQITREMFAYVMCGALPSSELSAINNITTVPDVKSDSTFGAYVYRLYNAGILTGSDKYGTFKPTTMIQRSEVATIVTRLADKSQRKTFTLEKKPPSVVTEVQLAGKTQISVGETTKWTAKPQPEDAATTITWTAGNPGVATVDANGSIKGLKAGDCNITATASNGVKKTVMIHVRDAEAAYQTAASIAKKSGYVAATEYLENLAEAETDRAYKNLLVEKLFVLYADWVTAAGSPLVIETYSTYRQDGSAFVDVKLRNLSGKTVTALSVEWVCVDANGKTVSEFEGYANSITMESHDRSTCTWRLYGDTATKSIKNVRVTKVTYDDGTTWTR